MEETGEQSEPTEFEPAVETQAPPAVIAEAASQPNPSWAQRLRAIVATLRDLRAAAGSAPWDPEPELQFIEAIASELEGVDDGER